jgi:hypothetical protein
MRQPKPVGHPIQTSGLVRYDIAALRQLINESQQIMEEARPEYAAALRSQVRNCLDFYAPRAT